MPKAPPPPASGKTPPRLAADPGMLQRILDAIALPVFAKDKAGRFVYLNDAACRLLGQPREALLGQGDGLLPPCGEGPAEESLTLDSRELLVRTAKTAGIKGRPDSALMAGHVLDISDLRNTELACTLNEKRLELLVQNLPVMIHAHDTSGAIVFWNRECERVLGYTAKEVLGDRSVFERFYPDPEYRARILAAHREGRDFRDKEVVVRTKDGRDRTIAWSLVSSCSPMHGWTSWETGLDVTEAKAAQNALADAERHSRSIVSASPMGVHLYRLEPDGRLVFAGANAAADKILHVDNSRFQGLALEEAFPGLAGTPFPQRLREICAEGGQWVSEQMDFRDQIIAGSFEMHCFQTEPGSCACMFLDLTERRLMETRLRNLSQYDPLTGIANRALCTERIATALQRAKRRHEYKYAVIYLDLDRFKTINDTLGHAAGDAVLVETARRVRSAVRELDTVARMGSDEFVVLMEEFDTYKRPVQAIKRIRAMLDAPFRVEGRELKITSSIGLALGEAKADTAEEVLRFANLAMHKAKDLGRNRIRTFSPPLLARTISVARLENEMERAIADGEFFLEFQPIIQVGPEQKLFGFEALARWRHPERGLIMPGEFIPVAENSGKVVELGYWALREGSRILNQWRRRYPHLEDAVLSVNLSPQQVPRPDFLPRMHEILKDSALPARNLKLEVTETALMQSGSTVLNKLHELRDMGVSFSVDDFGTGYSSLAYLTRLPLDHLKIDLSFVRMLEAGRENQEIVRAIIQLANGLDMGVVAEGVENEAQEAILRALGCSYFQGYLFARPLSVVKAEEFLQRFATVSGEEDGPAS